MENLDNQVGTTLTLEDAVLAIQVAITLGAEVPAPVGVSFYSLIVHWNKTELLDPMSPHTLGYYKTELDAFNALEDQILSTYSDELTGPWIPVFDPSDEDWMPWETYVTLRQEYLLTHSREDLFNYYFGEVGGYEIKKAKIEGSV